MGERFISLIAINLTAKSAFLTAITFISLLIVTSFIPVTAHAQAIQAQSKPPVQPPNKDHKPAAPVEWKKIPEPERKVLAPLEKDWSELPGNQQRKLIGAAKAYPKQVPIQQERFQERIKDWAKLSPDERHAARDKFKNLSSLPPEKQYELRERWNEKSEKKQPSLTATPSTPTAAPPSSASAGTTAK